jgi:hypothetical protein
MPRRKTTTTSTGDDNKGYEVGYGKPPTHSQFRPGQSGNPAGRRKGLRNLATDVKSTLGKPVKVKEGGRTRTRSTQEGLLMVLREKALRGDQRALELYLGLAGRHNTDGLEIGAAQALPADDQAILAAYVGKFAAAATTPPDESSDDPALKRGARSDKKKAPK